MISALGIPTRVYLDEILDIFFKLIDTEQDERVLCSLGVGLGHISPEPRKVKPLLKLKDHPDSDVRFGVAFGLGCEDDALAIQALIDLSYDEDGKVRDWATFALGSLTELDSPQIREALFSRVVDFNDTSSAPGEALVGLVKRQDERAFELLLNHIQAGNTGTLVFEAAEALADARLYPILVKLREDSGYDDYERRCLEEAIAACDSQS